MTDRSMNLVENKHKIDKLKNEAFVIECALSVFIEQGIEATSIKDIAIKSNFTERTIYRYFENKSELVLACVMEFWDKTTSYIESSLTVKEYEKLSGLELIKLILNEYGNLYYTSKKELIFINEVESYLSRHNLLINYANCPPQKLELEKGPLAKAIKKGMIDGSITTKDNLEALYYNTYDSLLGLLKQMALDQYSDQNITKLAQKRLNQFINLLINAYK